MIRDKDLLVSKIGDTPAVLRTPVVFTATIDAGSFDDGNGIPDKANNSTALCVVCHVTGSGPGSFVSSMEAHIGGDHTDGYANQNFSGTYCVTCHRHSYDNDTATEDGFVTSMECPPPEPCCDCFNCHVPGGLAANDTSSQFDGVYAPNPGIMSQHLIKADGIVCECNKCHGDTHPTPDARVVNADNNEITYSTSSYGGRIPDRLDEFCLSCHDGAAASGDVSDIQFNGIKPVQQLDPRGQGSVGPWNPNPPDEIGLDPFASRYTTLYYNGGHGTTYSLSPDRPYGPDYACTNCHVYHGTTNYRLMKTLPGSYDGSESYAYDGQDYNTYDDWCTFTCHARVNPRVVDHTFEALSDPESGDSRDASTETPSFVAWHPTSSLIPYQEPHPSDPVFWLDDPTQTRQFMSQVEILNSIISPYLARGTYDELCITCHDPHGSSIAPAGNNAMKRLGSDETVAGNLCEQCHFRYLYK